MQGGKHPPRISRSMPRGGASASAGMISFHRRLQSTTSESTSESAAAGQRRRWQGSAQEGGHGVYFANSSCLSR